MPWPPLDELILSKRNEGYVALWHSALAKSNVLGFQIDVVPSEQAAGHATNPGQKAAGVIHRDCASRLFSDLEFSGLGRKQIFGLYLELSK